MSSEECAINWHGDIRRFELTVLFSLLFTAAIGLFRLFKREWISNNLIKAYKIMAASSAVKLLIAILLFSVLNPKCPIGCQCGYYRPGLFYSTVVFLIGLYWGYIAYQYRQEARDGGSSGVDATGNELPATSNNEAGAAGDSEVV